MRRNITTLSGFTLVELLVVVAVMGIVLAIAAPTFNSMVAGYRITAEIDDLRGSIEYARSEAVKQGLNVLVCPSNNPSSDTATCSNQTAWASGWLVRSVDSCTSTTGVNLRQKNAFASTDIATYKPRTVGNNYICFNRFGFASTNYTGLFVVSLADGTSYKRCLSLSSIGSGQALNAGETDSSGVTCQ